MKILIIDDNIDEKIGQNLELLQKSNDVIICQDAKGAREYLKEHIKEIDLIITDLGLPEDIEETREVYDSYMGIKIIQENEFQISHRMIPIIINSRSELRDEDKKFFERSKIEYDHFECMAEMTPSRILEILSIAKHTPQSGDYTDNWNKNNNGYSTGSFYVDGGKGFHYRPDRDGD